MCFKREEVVASLSYGSFKSRNHATCLVYYALLGTVDCRFWGGREMTEHGREEDLFSFLIVCITPNGSVVQEVTSVFNCLCLCGCQLR
jgi:hypothetical protein